MMVLIVCLTMETIGYAVRIITIKHPGPLWSIIISQTFLVVAPAFFAGQDYMIVGRMMSYIGGEYSYIKHTRITKIFVGLDVLAILTQASGAALLTDAGGDRSKLQRSKNILLFGLALQVIAFGIFCFVAVSYNLRTRREPALAPFHEEMKHIKKLWIAFYVTGILIAGRSIYRTAEFAQVSFVPGSDNPGGYAVTHEWPLYTFDSLPILISTLILAVFHPGAYLPKTKGRRIDGTMEQTGGGCFGRKASRGSDDQPASMMALRPV